MIIEEITIKNWKGYREAHTFQFDEKFNLLLGRNEAGKSTIFEAFTRVLFTRHNSTAKEIFQIQPIGTSLAPEATIIIQSDGQRYKSYKRFIKASTSELYRWKNDQWQRIHEGDSADNVLRDILKGDHKPTLKPEHRGLSQALWYLQNDDPLPESEWGDAIRIGLSGFISHIAQSPEEELILKKLDKEFVDYFTPTGRIKKDSPPDKLENEIKIIEAVISSLREGAARVENQRQNLEVLFEETRGKEIEYKKGLVEIQTLEDTIAEGQELELKKKEKDQILFHTLEEEKKLKSDYDTINRRRKDIDSAQSELETLQGEAERHKSDERIEIRSAETLKQNWKETLTPNLQIVEESIGFLRAIEDLKHLEKDKSQIETKIEEIKSIIEESRIIKSKLLEESLPDTKDWQTLQKQREELNTIKAQAEISGIWVGFDFKEGNTKISAKPDPDNVNEDGEYLVLGPTSFTIGDYGTVTIRGGGPSLEELQTNGDSLDKKIQKVFKKFNVENYEEFYLLHQRRMDLEKEQTRLQKELKKITIDEDLDSLTQSFDTIEGNISIKKNECALAPPDYHTLAPEAIGKKIKDFEKQKKALIKDIKNEQQKEEEARKKSSELLELYQSAITQVTKLKSKHNTLQQENSQILKSYGTLEHLEKLLDQVAVSLKTIEADLSSINEEYRVRVEEPKNQLEQAEKIIDALDKQLQDNYKKITGIKASMETIFAQNLYSEMADQEAMLEVKKKQFERVNGQAKAILLLKNMAESFKEEQSTALSGPISELLNGWLAILTDDSYDEVRINEKLIPIEVQTPRYNDVLPMECLSFGTREQVVVLLRLAMGVLLSKDERSLVVIDDRLVNADPVRMRRLCQILDEVATKHCQIIVATCNDTPYIGINMNKIPVPGVIGRE